MNQLTKIFQGRELRIVELENEPWFVAKDVCNILGLTNPSKAVSRLDEDERSNFKLGRQGEANIVNEFGLYNLVLSSRKPEAKQFKRWITHEVIPSIRKTGGYVDNDELFVETYLPHADEQTRTMFRTTLQTVRKQNEKIEKLAPKADYFDSLVDRNLLTNFRDTAKELHMKQNKFINWLLDKKYIYRDQKNKLKPYSPYVPDLFELKEWERNGKADVQTLITPKGKETFRLLLKE